MILRTYSPQLFPSVAFAGLEAVNRLFEQVSSSPNEATALPAEVVQTESGVEVSFEAPGIEAKDLKVEVEGRVLSVTAERSAPTEAAGALIRTERFHGTISRSIELPFAVDASEVKAALKQGILTVSLTPIAEAKARRIEVLQS
jgi:HSP20 family protein